MPRDIGLLVLRVVAGAMMMGHGFGKVADVLAGRFRFPDPLGIGAAPSLVLAAFAEFLCAALVVLGVRTRLAALPVVATMLVAGLVFHWNDPWGDKELPLLYAAAFATLVFTGGGRYGLGSLVKRRSGRPKKG